MNAVPVVNPKTNKIIELEIIDGKLGRKPEVKYNKDGSVSKYKWNDNKVAGQSSEVYPFTSEEEIKAMIDVFNKHIEEAETDTNRQIAVRNKMMFIIGINISLRASDLVGLRYSFFIENNGEFKDFYSLQPKKTRKTGKFVKIYFNDAVKKAISDYIAEYPIENMNDYMFKSKKTDKHLTEISLGRIVKSTAEEAGIKQNICSHSLRKTFGRFLYHSAEDKNHALIVLQTIFNHSSPAVTSRYIGLTDGEVSDAFNSLNIGLEFL